MRLRSLPFRKPRQADLGVTLIEMMVVLVIIAIVAAIIVPNVIGRPDEARVTVAGSSIKTIAASLELYRLDAGRYPTTDQGLDSLVKKPTSGPLPRKWDQAGYLSDLPSDPWGNPFVYELSKSGNDYRILSYGADGKEGGSGVDADIVNK